MNKESMTTEQIWDLLGDTLRNFFLKRVSNKEIAEDLLQETFVRIHKNLDNIDDIQLIRSWVFQIARNIVIDYYRSKSHNAKSVEDDLEDDLDILIEEEENLNELVEGWLPQMITQLPNNYREAVELYELEGVPQKQIAERLGISLSGAKSRVQRGRTKLKSLLFNCCSFEQDRRGNVIGCSQNTPGHCDECDKGCDS